MLSFSFVDLTGNLRVNRAMTPQEAVAQVSLLMVDLINRVKDRKTADLVQKIQSLNQTIQTGYFAAEQKSLDRQQELFEANRKIAQMEDEHSKAIAAIQEKHRAEITKLTARNDPPSFEIIDQSPEFPGETIL